MKKLARLGFVLIAAIAIAMPAAARNHIAQVVPSIDLRGQVDAHEHVQPLRVLSNERTFDDVAHVEFRRHRSRASSRIASPPSAPELLPALLPAGAIDEGQSRSGAGSLWTATRGLSIPIFCPAIVITPRC